jgi:hypothetical protein
MIKQTYLFEMSTYDQTCTPEAGHTALDFILELVQDCRCAFTGDGLPPCGFASSKGEQKHQRRNHCLLKSEDVEYKHGVLPARKKLTRLAIRNSCLSITAVCESLFVSRPMPTDSSLSGALLVVESEAESVHMSSMLRVA